MSNIKPDCTWYTWAGGPLTLSGRELDTPSSSCCSSHHDLSLAWHLDSICLTQYESRQNVILIICVCVCVLSSLSLLDDAQVMDTNKIDQVWCIVIYEINQRWGLNVVCHMVTTIWCWKNDLDSCNLNFLLCTMEIIASNLKRILWKLLRHSLIRFWNA